MSQVYATEPSPSGTVTLDTSHGPIEIQLWCRECPLTTKYFVQLCHDGFFDSLKFHRIVPSFLLQTGLREDANKDISSYDSYRQAIQAEEVLDRQKLELHSRLRFNHRGQIAMAIQVDESYGRSERELLQPQFFITLDEAPYLDKKHVLFGTVRGPTMFNALRIGNVDIDTGTNAPIDMEHAPRIKSVKIHQESFDNFQLQPVENIPWKETVPSSKNEQKRKKKKRKGKRDANVLSFGDEFIGDGGDADNVGMQSSHDLIPAKKKDAPVLRTAKVDEKSLPPVEAATVVADPEDGPSVSNEVTLDCHPTPGLMVRLKTEMNDSTEETKNVAHVEEKEPVLEKSPRYRQQREQQQQEVLLAQNKKELVPAHTSAEKKAPKKLSAVEAMRAKYKSNKGTNKKQREDDTMAKLFQFQSKVRNQVSQGNGHGDEFDSTTNNSKKDNSLATRMAQRAMVEDSNSVTTITSGSDVLASSHYHGQILEKDDDHDDDSSNVWLATKFTCKQHLDHVAKGAGGRLESLLVGNGSRDRGPKGGDGRSATDDYVVIDESKDSDSKNGASNSRTHPIKRRHEHGARHSRGDSPHHRNRPRNTRNN